MTRIIAKVISGAQTGTDVAALWAAKSLGIPTGGTMAKDFMTLAGPMPEWAQEFGLVECVEPGYPPRTRANVADSDCTVRIAVCIMRAIVKLGRPVVPNIQVTGLRDARPTAIGTEAAAAFLRELSQKLGRPLIVNFAGNSEQTAPGIEAFAETVVRDLLARLAA